MELGEEQVADDQSQVNIQRGNTGIHVALVLMLIIVAAVESSQGKMSYFCDETSGKWFLALFGGLFSKAWFHFIEMAWERLGLPPVVATEVLKLLVGTAVAIWS